jgi:1,4-dihydroxy-2-naphthoate octaprenyltransferase
VPVLVAAGLAVHDGVLAPLPLLVAFLGSWLIHLGGVFADQHELGAPWACALGCCFPC